jgi:mono/diheme cytochrome c family protein
MEIYHQYCSVCHGDHGDGRSRARQGLVPPPRDFTTPGLTQDLSRKQMIDSVLNGRAGTAMAGWRTRLSRQQAEAVVDYVRNTFMSGTAAAAANAPPRNSDARPNAGRPRGNFAAGKKLYAANCTPCHGIDGDGKGPRAYFIFPKPRDFTAESARLALDPARLFVAVRDGVTGREMPAWGKVLSDQQIADVGAYVHRAFVNPDGVAADRR